MSNEQAIHRTVEEADVKPIIFLNVPTFLRAEIK